MATDEDLINCKDFPAMVNTKVFDILKGSKPRPLPIWIMRQAGRYLPEFMKMRKKHDFFEICKTPSLACEVTLMPIRRFKFDAAIIFSDILVIPMALGMKIEMKTGIGPVFHKPLSTESMIDLSDSNLTRKLKYVSDAITLTRHKLKGEAVLYGFTGAPWTLMCYMIEGQSTKTCANAKKWLYCYQHKAKELLELLTKSIVEYVVMQINAGAQVIQIFDTCAEHLNKDLYITFCFPYVKRIREEVNLTLKQQGIPTVPMAIFAKGAYYCVGELIESGFEIIGLDWSIDPSDVLAITAAKGKKVIFQGNLDPCALYADPVDLRRYTDNMIKRFNGLDFIVNLGHGIYPDTPVENVYNFVRFVREITARSRDEEVETDPEISNCALPKTATVESLL